MSDERQAFAQRLAAAMQAKGYEAKPGVLLVLFNSHYTGRSIGFSSASKWLRGMTLPEQDKLQVLADLFGVEPQTLRYGTPVKTKRIAEPQMIWPAGTGARERRVFEAYLALPPKRREIVDTMVAALGQYDEKA